MADRWIKSTHKGARVAHLQTARLPDPRPRVWTQCSTAFYENETAVAAEGAPRCKRCVEESAAVAQRKPAQNEYGEPTGIEPACPACGLTVGGRNITSAMALEIHRSLSGCPDPDEKVTVLDTSRIAVRVTPEQYALIEKAATIEGLTVEEFTRYAAVVRAKSVIAQRGGAPNAMDVKPNPLRPITDARSRSTRTHDL